MTVQKYCLRGTRLMRRQINPAVFFEVLWSRHRPRIVTEIGRRKLAALVDPNNLDE